MIKKIEKEKIDLNKLTDAINLEFIGLGISLSDDKKGNKILYLQDAEKLSKYDQERINQIIKDHNPEFSDEEMMIKNQQEDFDNQVRESLARIGFTLPKK